MNYDVIVIGAGPAGMAAAVESAAADARVLLLDDQPAPGGQIYRAVETGGGMREKILGEEYTAGKSLAADVRAGAIEYLQDATVWQVTDDREVGYSHQGKAKLVRAPAVILATGAMERPFPIPGWELPGVMMAGAAQTLLKTSGLAAASAVFAGSGPLLYLVVSQYLRAGIKVRALLDTTDSGNRWGAFKHLGGALARWDLMSKGRRWIADIKGTGTPMISGVSALRINGEETASGISYRKGSGAWQDIEAEHIFLHQGVVPNVNLSMAAGIDHRWSPEGLCWRPQTDAWGQTNLEGIVVAGDGAGIGGAVAAEAAGRIAALGMLCELGRIAEADRNRFAATHRKTLQRELKARPFLDAWFRPADHFRLPADENTILCRCEELSLKDIRDVVEIGLAGPNQLKSYCRAGMGPCQGRFCGLSVQELIARETGRSPADVGYYRLRPPIKPLPLDELAELDAEPEANTAARTSEDGHA